MRNVKRNAKKFLKELNEELNYLNVKHYCEKKGYKVLLFGNNTTNNSIMKSLGLSVPDYKKGLLYVNSNHKYIFINDGLDEFARLETLLHEVGHMVLEHKNSMLRNEVQECEANEFTLSVLNVKRSKKRFLRSAYIVPCLVTMALLIISVILKFPDTESKSLKKDRTNTIAMEEIDTVYVSPYGECYHKPNCNYISNSTVFAISSLDASGTYRPCKMCIK